MPTNQVSSMTCAPDETCRLKFPVVAEKLIEYSGARHEERSRRTPTNRGNLALEGKTFAAVVVVVLVLVVVVGYRKCVPKSGERLSRRDLFSGERWKIVVPPRVSPAYYRKFPVALFATRISSPSLQIEMTEIIQPGEARPTRMPTAKNASATVIDIRPSLGTSIAEDFSIPRQPSRTNVGPSYRHSLGVSGNCNAIAIFRKLRGTQLRRSWLYRTISYFITLIGWDGSFTACRAIPHISLSKFTRE